MRIHHLDCGPMRPLGGRLIDGVSRGAFGRMTCHCLAIETGGDAGVVLVDTGFGLRDRLRPYPRLSRAATAVFNVSHDPDRAMIRQLKALGIHPREVRHVVMTHLDFDHAGGLVDFPQARVHLTEPEAAAARRRAGVKDRMRYRPAQWGDTGRWRTYPARTQGRWFGFDAVAQLDGLPPEILLVPLPGHTAGHAGVAIQGPGGWLLHAGDTYLNRREVHGDGGCPAGAAAFEALFAWRRDVASANQARLRALVREPDAPVAVFCTHDPVEYAAMSLLEERRSGGGALQRPEAANDAGAVRAA